MARAQRRPGAVDLPRVWFDPDWLVRELVEHLGELVGVLVAVAFGPAAARVAPGRGRRGDRVVPTNGRRLARRRERVSLPAG